MRAVFWTILMCCVLASCTPASWRDTWAKDQLKKLEMAESLWQAKNLQHYQMTVSRNGWCEQEFEVNGDVTTVISDTCFFGV